MSNGDTIYGTDADDILEGGDGNDILDGGSGADDLRGGDGNDRYIIDNVNDTITEGESKGTDIAWSTASTFTLDDNVENLLLRGSSDIDGVGNNLANTIIGNSGANTLTGNGGNDTLKGYGGDDILEGGDGNDILDGGSGADDLRGGDENDKYIIDNVNDTITEGESKGTDTAYSTASTFTLSDNVENLILRGSSDIDGVGNDLANTITGNSGANTLTGNGGNDVLNGGSGADDLRGGDGNDRYIVDNVNDTITEESSEGTDIAWSTASTFTLSNNVENLLLRGSSDIDGVGNDLANTITGNSGANTLTGNGGNDTLNGYGGDDILEGGDGNDILDGGSGADDLRGGDGNDRYIIDNVNDTITEGESKGTDIAYSTASTFTLSNNVENLLLRGSSDIDGVGNDLANTIRGNSGANKLTGNGGNDTLKGYGGDDILEGGDGNDILDGGSGADDLRGGDGNDRYIIDNVNDTITEGESKGTDIAWSTASTFTLSDNVENLLLRGSSDIDGVGNDLANRITGNSGANTLTGNGGHDILDGGSGADDLRGGDGNDLLGGGSGDDILNGGGDTDTAFFSNVANQVDLRITVSQDTGDGNDTLTSIENVKAGGGDDTVYGNSEANILSGQGGVDTLYGYGGNDTLNGGSGADDLRGGDGNDILNGGSGADDLRGGDGNDKYIIDNVNDTITEGDSKGTDTAYSTASTFTLDDNVENLNLRGSSDIDGVGNDLANNSQEIVGLIY